MAAQPQHPTPALCPPRKPSTLQGTGTAASKRSQSRILNTHTQPCNSRNSAPVGEHPAPWPTVPPPFLPLCLPSYRGPLASIRDLHSQELPPTMAAIPPGTHMSLCPPTLEAPLGEGKGHVTGPWLYVVDLKQVTLQQLSPPPATSPTVLLNTPEQLSEYSSIK